MCIRDREHASGINQVNQAISEMDQMTQENASMVEQNAVASKNMAQEANRLRKMFISTKDMNHQLEQSTNHHPNQETVRETIIHGKAYPIVPEKTRFSSPKVSMK